MFASAPPEDTAFPSAHCGHCQRQVLLWRDLDPEGQLVPRCLDCDHPIEEPVALRWSSQEIHQEGYVLEGHRGDNTPGGCRGGHCGT